MAGIYIHIPFCRQKCYYCDFYKTVNTALVPKFLAALQTEILLRKNFAENETIETIYFGGGTPSVLTETELEGIFGALHRHFQISQSAEITFEANPDDLTAQYLQSLKTVGVNRLSIGIQSFHDEFLKKMNRRHNAGQAVAVVENAAKMGFQNISVDLIYGLPGLPSKAWKADLGKVFQMPVQHLSAYHLTFHEGTPFYTWLKKGTLKELKEKDSIAQFDTLVKQAGLNGFEQYEISNFARNGLYSQHNSGYWLGKKYLGLGPSAHSFDGNTRSWNVPHVESYIKAVENNLPFSESETLTENDKYNEYIITRIRTKWGVSVRTIQNGFGDEKANYFKQNIKKYVDLGLVEFKNDDCFLTTKGMFVSDEIMQNLMII